MLVRLTEVYARGGVAAPNNYLLREIFVNPEHVVMVREERRVKEMNELGKLHEDLDPKHQFSKITVNRGTTGTEIVVIGGPDVVEEKLNSHNKRQLLKG